MKATASSLLRPVVESVERIARTGDMDALGSLLLGRGLPVLGGDAEPVEVLMRALGPSQAPAGLAQVLGAVLAAEVTGLTQEGVTPDRRMLLRGAFRLAAELPPQADLFRALQKLTSSLEEKVDDLWSGDSFGPLLARALAYQQTDGAMEDFWLHLLRKSSQKTSTPERRTVLLMAWRGLLRVSPSEETRQNGNVVDIDRIERGLLALYGGEVSEREGGARLIRLALNVLAETFPRSPQFWEERLGLRVVRWPDELQEEAIRKWPGLRTGETPEINTPQINAPSLEDQMDDSIPVDEKGTVSSYAELYPTSSQIESLYSEIRRLLSSADPRLSGKINSRRAQLRRLQRLEAMEMGRRAASRSSELGILRVRLDRASQALRASPRH